MKCSITLVTETPWSAPVAPGPPFCPESFLLQSNSLHVCHGEVKPHSSDPREATSDFPKLPPFAFFFVQSIWTKFI